MSGPGMNYPGFQGQMPSFNLPWMSGPTPTPGGNTIMGMNPPGGPMPGTGPGFAQGGPIQGPSAANGPGFAQGGPIQGGPTTGTGMGGPTMGSGPMGPGTGGNTGGNIDWHHIMSGPQTGTGQQMSPLMRAILGSRYGTPTPGNRFNIA